MTHARQRLGKHVPKVTLSTTEGRLKAAIVKSTTKQRLTKAQLPWNYTRFRHNAYMNNSRGTLEGREFYPVLPKL
jgi:hypothetical protein